MKYKGRVPILEIGNKTLALYSADGYDRLPYGFLPTNSTLTPILVMNQCM